MARATISVLSLCALLLAPAALAQDPPEYSCLLVGNGKSLPLAMRFGPDHVAGKFAGEWKNLCEETTSTCALDAQGRIKANGVGRETGVVGDLLFDPSNGVLTLTMVGPEQTTITVTGTCRRPVLGLS